MPELACGPCIVAKDLALIHLLFTKNATLCTVIATPAHVNVFMSENATSLRTQFENFDLFLTHWVFAVKDVALFLEIC